MHPIYDNQFNVLHSTVFFPQKKRLKIYTTDEEQVKIQEEIKKPEREPCVKLSNCEGHYESINLQFIFLKIK